MRLLFLLFVLIPLSAALTCYQYPNQVSLQEKNRYEQKLETCQRMKTKPKRRKCMKRVKEPKPERKLECRPDVNNCVTLNVLGNTTRAACEANNECGTIANGCHAIDNTTTICCCNGNLCNSATSPALSCCSCSHDWIIFLIYLAFRRR
ncbi:hypothetical protein PMAYCL1PPCAC_04621 [Pristionchus mayeri]|uniref:Uncharacterized protein n=1 Tax=Pristionchus mayeri TaxID=1317129 RepID=A0AAN4Z5H0_9BILA|nr:hypothetical protein PMAYCL1PPCAC_04621 [Pristionchus mayeri]